MNTEIKDFNGKSVVERLEEKCAELADCLRLESGLSRKVLLECIDVIREASKSHSSTTCPASDPTIWRPIPENSTAPSLATPKSAVAVISNRLEVLNERVGGLSPASLCSSSASSSAFSSPPSFPLTSPFLHSRHSASKRSNGFVPRTSPRTTTCNYQSPTNQNLKKTNYDNIPQPTWNYDNIPTSPSTTSTPMRWKHDCENAKKSGSATIGVAATTKSSVQQLRQMLENNSGHQTVPSKLLIL